MTGTVRHIDLEGGFWALEADDGSRFVPMNLAEHLRVEGLRVAFELTEERFLSFVQWGRTVRLRSARRLA